MSWRVVLHSALTSHLKGKGVLIAGEYVCARALAHKALDCCYCHFSSGLIQYLLCSMSTAHVCLRGGSL
jgi:hypothetical protein